MTMALRKLERCNIRNKSVLISIRPEWCNLIADGKKTVEVRKTRPKLETPFKCYIYCTVGGIKKMPKDYLEKSFERGSVIGEFICDHIIKIHVGKYGLIPISIDSIDLSNSMLSPQEIICYIGNGQTGYGWHISELKIYDKPRKIGEFLRICRNDLYCESCAMYSTHNGNCGNVSLQVRRPPQSWCYVKEGVFGA